MIARSLRDSNNKDTYRESQKAIGWTEDTCRHLDQIANEDTSYVAKWSESQRHENNGTLALNAQGRNAPMTEREDHSEAVKEIKDEQESNHPVLPSHQTSQKLF